jgi:hypothetical protein
MILSPPIQVGAFATGRQICVGEVVRASMPGVVAAHFDECRFLLDEW